MGERTEKSPKKKRTTEPEYAAIPPMLAMAFDC
jgi:hypothetical protein